VDDDTDYKWADKETFYNEDFDEVELGIWQSMISFLCMKK
jgi:hypothetical protein